MADEQMVPENNFEEVIASENVKKNFATPELVNDWKKWYLKTHTQHSTVTYFGYIKRYVGYEGIEISNLTVDKFRNKSQSGVSAGALKNFFNFLVNNKDFPRDILDIHFDKSKSKKKAPQFISPSDVERIIGAMVETREKLLTRVTYELALRISEVLKLQWSDFSWASWLVDRTKDGEVILRETKGQNYRTIPVSSKLMNELYDSHQMRDLYGVPIAIPGRNNSLLFDYGIDEYKAKSKITDEEKYQYIVIKAEDEYRKILYKVSESVIGYKIHPHTLRHVRAKDMMDHDVPIETIKEYLGHADISSTQVYAKASSSKIHKDMGDYYKNE